MIVLENIALSPLVPVTSSGKLGVVVPMPTAEKLFVAVKTFGLTRRGIVESIDIVPPKFMRPEPVLIGAVTNVPSAFTD